jgi:hypothetical protein
MDANANAGIGGGAQAATASAAGTLTAATGSASAAANANLYKGVVESAQATASSTVDGKSIVIADAGIGTAYTSLTAAGDSFANVIGAPGTSNVNLALHNDTKSIAAFGAGTTYLGLAQLDGAHTASGAGVSETATTSFSLGIDTAQIANSQDLKIAFIGGKDAAAASITDVHLTVAIGDTTLVNQDFSTAASALTWFTDNPVDLGALSSFSAGGVIDLQVMLSVTSTSAASTFGGTMVVGNAAGSGATAADVIAMPTAHTLGGHDMSPWFDPCRAISLHYGSIH